MCDSGRGVLTERDSVRGNGDIFFEVPGIERVSSELLRRTPISLIEKKSRKMLRNITVAHTQCNTLQLLILCSTFTGV